MFSNRLQTKTAGPHPAPSSTAVHGTRFLHSACATFEPGPYGRDHGRCGGF